MSFFSRIKEKASAVTKAAEKYMTQEEQKAAEAQQEYKVKPKATTPSAAKDAKMAVEAPPKDSSTPKKNQNVQDPLKEMVKQAANEYKQKMQSEDEDKPGTPGYGELQELKAILRSKMIEHDELVDETSKRDTEYQKLLQENDNKIKELTEQLNKSGADNKEQANPDVVDKLKQGLLSLEKENEELRKQLEECTPNTTEKPTPININTIKEAISKDNKESKKLK